MFKESYKVIGVMSGTSLDGIDLACVQFNYKSGLWNFSINEAKTIPYPEFWFNQLQQSSHLSKEVLADLDKKYTAYLAETILQFIQDHTIENLDAVCSHGHTVLHEPNKGITYQIGNLPEIKEILNEKVICNFRVEDVQLGGQGAPLVPIGERLLFKKYDYCINLGGFSNISFENEGSRVAFDICAVNTVLNHYANKCGFDFDMDGKMASSGKINSNLLQSLNALEYYESKAPKSLGIEYVNQILLPLIDSYNLNILDVLATFCEHIAIQIQKSLPNKKRMVLLSGGGTYNQFLIEKLKEKAPHIDFYIPEIKIIEYKEALIFGFLGVLKLRNEINVLSSVTGAQKDHVAGYIF